jgi:hypothetical protein
MPEIFRTAAAPGAATEALVVHCSSARFQQPLHAFLIDGLRLRKYSLMAVPGGVQALTLLDYLPKFSWAGWRWAKFLIDLEKPPRLILVGHEECAWYRDMRFWARKRSTREAIVADLRQVANDAAERFPGARIETYYASTAAGQVVFETI